MIEKKRFCKWCDKELTGVNTAFCNSDHQAQYCRKAKVVFRDGRYRKQQAEVNGILAELKMQRKRDRWS